MRKSTHFSRQTSPNPNIPRGKKGQIIHQLSASDDLGALFSCKPKDNNQPSFADVLTSGITTATFAEILAEKETSPPSATARQIARKNSVPPQEQIDLHGCTALEAETRTKKFLALARCNHLKTVLVITGKGLHSQGGPVLKEVIESLLKIMKNDRTIFGYSWERKSREQSGAILVYLP